MNAVVAGKQPVKKKSRRELEKDLEAEDLVFDAIEWLTETDSGGPSDEWFDGSSRLDAIFNNIQRLKFAIWFWKKAATECGADAPDLERTKNRVWKKIVKKRKARLKSIVCR